MYDASMYLTLTLLFCCTSYRSCRRKTRSRCRPFATRCPSAGGEDLPRGDPALGRAASGGRERRHPRGRDRVQLCELSSAQRSWIAGRRGHYTPHDGEKAVSAALCRNRTYPRSAKKSADVFSVNCPSTGLHGRNTCCCLADGYRSRWPGIELRHAPLFS